MNPRRLYYFLRVASFLFQNKTPELFAYVQQDHDFTSKLVKHLSSVHIMQLVLNMLKLEEQMKDLGVPNCEWSVVCYIELFLLKPSLRKQTWSDKSFRPSNSLLPPTLSRWTSSCRRFAIRTVWLLFSWNPSCLPKMEAWSEPWSPWPKWSLSRLKQSSCWTRYEIFHQFLANSLTGCLQDHHGQQGRRRIFFEGLRTL